MSESCPENEDHTTGAVEPCVDNRRALLRKVAIGSAGAVVLSSRVGGDRVAAAPVPAPAPAPAPAYNLIAPQRAYDSRQPNYAVTGVMAPNTSRVISIADGHGATGLVTLANAVPVGAVAVLINVTATQVTGPNFVAVTAGGASSTETSVLNWSTVDIANSITVPVDASRQIKVFCGGQVGSAHVIIDVFGYYL